MYDRLSLYIDGQWIEGGNRPVQPVFDPATDAVIGELPHASESDIDLAVGAADRAFQSWRDVSAYERSKILRRAAELLRQRSATIGRQITLDQGKPLAEAIGEVNASADSLEWHAEEGRRAYGRIIPSRHPSIQQTVQRQPVGVCAAFTPWNFPMIQAVQKIAAAFAAGCTVVLKGPEDSPAGVMHLARALADAGLPAGCLNVVWGEPAKVSERLISDPIVRKISFTGSVAVGKQLASLAGRFMKRTTMELGGHAPVLVFDDCDLESAVTILADRKIRNAGQACGAPTRFYVQRAIYDEFCERFTKAFGSIRVGSGLEEGVQMGPLCHDRRMAAMTGFIDDARAKGAEIAFGGDRIGDKGNFFAPTVIVDAPETSRVMTEEPFGPVAAMVPFTELDEAVAKANALEYGLSSFLFTRSLKVAHEVGRRLDVGAVNINHVGVGMPETPFGGIKDSGYGSEGGQESLEGYMTTKFLTQMAV